jgi:hypothetical protein
MHTRLVLLLLGVTLCSPLAAQFRRSTVTIGAGPAIPGGDLTNIYSPTGFIRVGYGYRIFSYIQAETGLDVGFRAAGVKDYYDSQFGPLRIRDYQYMVPMGGRLILPLRVDRIRLSAGGGGVYLRYSERTKQPFANSGIRIDCPVCSARSGWGYYSSLGASFAITERSPFRLGGTVNVYRATTDGQGVGVLPPGPSADRWVNAAIEFSFTF